MGGIAGAAAWPGCAGDETDPTQQSEDLRSCNKKKEHALAPRGVWGNIQHIVVLMMENRSFDHYFGALSIDPNRTDEYGNSFGGEGRTDVNGLTGDEFNLNLAGDPVRVFRQLQTLQGDIAHEWEDCHRQFDFDGTGIGKNDGFVKQHELDIAKGDQSYCGTYEYFGLNVGCPDPNSAMGIYSREEVPVLYALADNYTLCDNWFSSVLGPTWPNRFYLHAGDSKGVTGGSPALGLRTIWEHMSAHCLRGINYYCDLPWAQLVGEGFLLGSKLGDGEIGGILQQFHASQPGFGSFYQDVQDDDLAPFCVIDPGYSSGYDDHPPADVALGQAFISYVYRILASNPKVWAKTLFVITYDEHGSYYDHVVPPGDIPGSPQSFDERPEFRQLGIRVPSLVIGPHAKKRHVSHVQYDHVSVINTVTKRFDLTANNNGWINSRVKNANDLSDCIEQGVEPTPEAAPPPADVPVLEFSEKELMEATARGFADGQKELSRMFDEGEFPQERDLRPYREKNMQEFLEIGEKVGAFKVKR